MDARRRWVATGTVANRLALNQHVIDAVVLRNQNIGRSWSSAQSISRTPRNGLFFQAACNYGGGLCVRRDALEAIGGFDTSIEFRGEDINLGRRLARVGSVSLSNRCCVYTSARRYHALGTRAVFGLYVRNFCSEIFRHKPSDTAHVDVRAQPPTQAGPHGTWARRNAPLTKNPPAITPSRIDSPR